MRRAPALFSYYIFTASIMHVTSRESGAFGYGWGDGLTSLVWTVMRDGNDVQASVGLQKTMDVLKRMSVCHCDERSLSGMKLIIVA